MRPISRRVLLGTCGVGLAFGAGCLGDADRADGRTRWEAPLEAVESLSRSVGVGTATVQYAPSWSSPVVACDAVVVGTSRGVVAVSLTDGAGLWRVPTESRVVASPAVADGTIVVADGSGTVRALTGA